MLTTNRPERAAPGSVLFVGDRPLVVASARQHHQRWLLCFEGVADRDAAEALRGAVLTAGALAEAGNEGDLWVHELVGAEARCRDGRMVGRVTAVEANPAHDLLVLDDGTLVPVVFVVEQQPGIVVIDPPDGLLELGR